jgi:hypothetical protein
VLAKTWHSPHLRAFLGPDDSFIVWHPDLIRWGNLPSTLEDTLQSWLTPSGWRVGPPRIVTWGPDGAFFCMSEYGDVVYRLGDDDSWEIYAETIQEWKAEKSFQWSDLAFIALDPTSADQFIAIRNDGTWAGSIDDANEDALESFALNFFALAKQPKNRPGPNPTSAQPPPQSQSTAAPNAASQALYAQWSADTATSLAAALAALSVDRPKPPRKLQVRSPSAASTSSSPSPSIPSPAAEQTPLIPPHATAPPRLLTSFPYLPAAATACTQQTCAALKADAVGIRACKHDVEALLRASGLFSYEWLRQERLRWHPDRFGRLCEEGWRDVGRKMAEEMFKIVDALVEEVRTVEGRTRSGGGK